MTQTIENAEMSTQLGRRWLNQFTDTPFQLVLANEASLPTDEIAIVNIPYFDEAITSESEISPQAPEPDQSTVVDSSNLSPSIAGGRKLDSVETIADLVEVPHEWIERKETPVKPREQPIPLESLYNAAIVGLVETILDRFPLAAPSLLLFVGSEANPHTDETCAQVAYSLANRKVGDVLLVDSNLNGNLTQLSQLVSEPGVSDVVNQGTDWKPLVVKEPLSGLDFMPSGIEPFDRWGGVERLRIAAAEMKKNYQFICVSAGNAHSDVAKTWSGICDGSYLLVSLKNSNKAIAESAVAELQLSGARLLGCVVTDSE